MTTTSIQPQKATCLISGASGVNGTALAKLFSERGIPVRAMIRNRARAGALLLPGDELVEGDFDVPASLDAALDGVERAFLLSPSSERAPEQQIAFVESARKSGVRHIVKLSQLDADMDSPARFLRYLGAVEGAIRRSGMAYTFLRPNLFMQAVLNFRSTITAQNAFYAPAGEGKISLVDIRDIAEAAFAALTQPGHEGKTYDLTGPEALTHVEMAVQISHAIGRTVAFVDVPPQAMRETLLGIGFPVWQTDGLIEEYAGWSQNSAAHLASGVQEATGHAPRSFSQFARDYAAQLS